MDFTNIFGLSCIIFFAGLLIGFFLPKTYSRLIDMFLFASTLLRRHLKSYVTPILGVGISIMIFTSMFAALDGMMLTMEGTEVSRNLVVRKKGEVMSYSSALNISMREGLKTINHVEQVSPVVMGYVVDINETYHLIRGIEFETYREVVNIDLIQGRHLNSSDKPIAALAGKYYFEQNNLTLGKNYTLTLYGGKKPPFTKKYTFSIVGVFETGMLQDSELWMKINACRKIIGMKNNKTSTFIVKVDHPKFMENVSREIEAKFEDEKVEAIPENDEWKFMSQVYDQFLVIIQLLLLTAFVTAIMGIMNVMVNIVDERKRDIAILKSIGYSNWLIFGIFTVESIFIGAIGGSIGLLIAILVFRTVGLSISAAGYTFNLILTTQTMINSVLFSITIGLISSLFPVYKAVRVRPIETLRM